MNLDKLQIFDQDLTLGQLNHYKQAQAIAVDTETMGLVVGRDRLCLVQLCDEVGQVSVVRIARGQKAAPHLKQLMQEPQIVKIFHYARFDVAQLSHNLGINTNPIFCTKIASKLGRTYTSSHGLKSLVMDLEGVELDKTVQSSDWGNAANLSAEQLSYAANDVRYLHRLRDKLTAMLDREERLELAKSCFSSLPTIVQLDLNNYSAIFEH